MALLEQGRRFFPTNGELILGQAMLAANRGERTEVIGLLREALRPDVDLSAEGRAAAQQMAALFAGEHPEPRRDDVAHDVLSAVTNTAG